MAATARKVTRIQSDWLCRDIASWRVRVPCVGGSARFLFKEYGGSENALKTAKKFQKKALKLLEEDRKYYAKHGEVPYRESLSITNTSGYTGVFRIVAPTKLGQPLVTWFARWSHNGKAFIKSYSTAQYASEAECKKRAIQKRQEMMAHVILQTTRG